MKTLHLTALALVLGTALTLPLTASADTVSAAEHASHHPKTEDATPAAAVTSADAAPATKEMCAKQIQRMQDMHAKVVAAKTPAERKKLLGEQRKLMQEMMTNMNSMMDKGGMGMMGGDGMKDGMKGGDSAAGGGMMMRMDMMQQMMQSMMDQQAGKGMMGQ